MISAHILDFTPVNNILPIVYRYLPPPLACATALSNHLIMTTSTLRWGFA